MLLIMHCLEDRESTLFARQRKLLQVSGPVGRTKAVKLAINITRWLITIHDLQLLPPSPRYEMYERVERMSPYPGKGI